MTIVSVTSCHRQIGNVNKRVYEKPHATSTRILWKEYEKTPDKGLFAEVKRLCELYELPDVIEAILTPEFIKNRVKHMYYVLDKKEFVNLNIYKLMET